MDNGQMPVKKKICISCGECKPIFSKGRCMSCVPKKPLTRSPIKQKAYYIPKQTEKNKTYRKSQSAIRDVYFDHHINLCQYSEESGVKIFNPSRANICHVFDKARHPSLQGNIENYVYLTLDEHTEFDNLLYRHEFVKLELKFPNSWAKACERVKGLLSLCEETTKFKIKLEEYLCQ
jgi:hypothetical protein